MLPMQQRMAGAQRPLSGHTAIEPFMANCHARCACIDDLYSCHSLHKLPHPVVDTVTAPNYCMRKSICIYIEKRARLSCRGSKV